MKLIKCRISSFGNLNGFEYDFSDGLNTVKQDNGWGKSTLGAFIKAMFYGLDDGRRSVAENERVKYRPWNNAGAFGGSIEFKWGNGEYRLERFFGSKKSEDSVRLFDSRTGKEFSNTENLGTRIFQIDEEGFLSTTFFSQKDFEAKSNASITAKFNEVNEIQDTALYEKAVSGLETKAKSYKYSGGRGIIPELKAESFSVGEKIERAKRAGRQAEELKENIKKTEAETLRLKARCERLIDEIREAGKAEAFSLKKRQRDKAAAELSELNERKAAVKRVFKGVVPDGKMIADMEKCAEEYGRTVEREKMLIEDVAAIERAAEHAPKKSVKAFVAALSAFVVCFIAAIVFVALKQLPLFAAFSAASVVSAVAAIVLFLKKNKPAATPENALYEKKKAELAEYSLMKERYKNALGEVLSAFDVPLGDGYSFAISEIKRKTEEITALTERIRVLETEINNLERETDFSALPAAARASVETLKSELVSVQEEYGRNAQILAARKADAKALEAEADALCDYENRKAEIAEKIARSEEELDTVKTTLDFLKLADENLKVKYRAPMRDSLNKYLAFIAGDVVADIDTDLKISVEEKSGIKDTDYYSKGFRNLFEICKRFALADVLFTAEKPFIVLDDPFVNLDDGKLRQALSLVKDLSREYQIIYLVCHESRKI